MVFQNWNNGMLESWNDGFKETNIPTFHTAHQENDRKKHCDSNKL
jgi:hypothetical protein